MAKATLASDWQNKTAFRAVTGRGPFPRMARSTTPANANRGNKAHPCDSAFLAERGCLSRTEFPAHPRPASH